MKDDTIERYVEAVCTIEKLKDIPEGKLLLWFMKEHLSSFIYQCIKEQGYSGFEVEATDDHGWLILQNALSCIIQGKKDEADTLVSAYLQKRIEKRKRMSELGKQPKSDSRREETIRRYDELIAQGKDKRNVASIIAKRLGVTPQHVRQIIRSLKF